MIFDAYLTISGVCLALALIAELGKKPLFGLVASILLFVGGLYLLTDGLQLKTGEIVNYAGTDSTTGTNYLLGNSTAITAALGNETNTTFQKDISLNETLAYGRNETKSYVYSDMPTTPYFDFVELLGMAYMLIAIGGMGVYAFDMRG